MPCSVLWHSIHSAPVLLIAMSYKTSSTTNNRSAQHLEGLIWSRYHSLLTCFVICTNSLGRNILESIAGQCQTSRFLHRNSHISTTNGLNRTSRHSNSCSEAQLSDGTCMIIFGHALITLLATQNAPNIFGFLPNMFGTFIYTPSSAVLNETYVSCRQCSKFFKIQKPETFIHHLPTV